MSGALALGRTSALHRQLAVLALGLALLLGVIFPTEVVAAISVWMGSTAYNHCFLILPIALWLAWHRRALLVGLPLRPTALALPAALALGVAWFVADRLGVMVGRQLVVIAFVQLLFFSVLGWALYRALLVPLLYLFLLVPFGGFLVPLLQTFSTHFVVHGLNLIGIPNYSEGNVIEIPQGAFYIAEACAGLRFLIAAFAFGVLYACVIYRSGGRRLLFMIASVVVPVIANGLRCLGIVWLGNVLGSASAAATDHVLYGYLFFSIVLLLLILLGLVFREDTSLERAPATATAARAVIGKRRSSFLPAGAIVVLAAAFPFLGSAIDRAAAATPPLAPIAFPGCTALASGTAPPVLESAGATLRRFSCRNGTITLDLALFSPRTDPRRLVTAKRWLGGEDTREAETRALTIPGRVPSHWDLTLIKDPPAAAASGLWIDGKPAPENLRTRARQALNSLFGSRTFPLVVAVKASGPADEARRAVTAFLRSGGVPADALVAITARRSVPRP